ncbi:hypothetical protein ILYODFUR_022242 [Ilyodon furcidens]|uniref:Uncharacterized protein n=1 Tax=Ilyodon furcidens TaxID=33524 RepID=A0ABV0TN80_9TELE
MLRNKVSTMDEHIKRLLKQNQFRNQPLNQSGQFGCSDCVHWQEVHKFSSQIAFSFTPASRRRVSRRWSPEICGAIGRIAADVSGASGHSPQRSPTLAAAQAPPQHRWTG